MKNPRTKALGLMAGLTLVSLLTGCGMSLNEGSSEPSASATPSPTASTATVKAPEAVDLSSTANVNSLCGAKAKAMQNFVTTAEDADAGSDERLALKEHYGIYNPTDSVLHELVASLMQRAKTSCNSNTNTDSATEDGTVGVENADGSVVVVPVVTGSDAQTIVIDTTTQSATPPLLDGSLRFTAQTLSWAGLVDRVGIQQNYIDGLNARVANTGFAWDGVQKFASVNKIVNGKIQGVNALAIQVFNKPNLTDEQVRDQVRKYITPEVEEIIGLTVNELPLQRINNGFTNTRNAGTADNLQMQDYFDPESMIRVSLMPFKFNEKGEVVALDGSRGAGIFIDCGNLHWVPVAVWKCTSASCVKPVCPTGMIGSPPDCHYPPQMCPWNGNLPKDSPNCLQPKGNRTPDNGFTHLGAGPLTNGKLSQQQQASGETRGNVTDNTVSEDTKSDDTTTELPKGTVDSAPGATPGGDATSDDAVDTTNTNQDNGGTQGDTCITDPDTGVRTCTK
ncbi:MAG: hypothetical protein ACOH18_01130 [Candidatus Saccharimonadaceae bacterium]